MKAREHNQITSSVRKHYEEEIGRLSRDHRHLVISLQASYAKLQGVADWNAVVLDRMSSYLEEHGVPLDQFYEVPGEDGEAK